MAVLCCLSGRTSAKKNPSISEKDVRAILGSQPLRVPDAWRSCHADSDCIEGHASCDDPGAINQAHLRDLERLVKKTCRAGEASLTLERTPRCNAKTCEFTKSEEKTYETGQRADAALRDAGIRRGPAAPDSARASAELLTHAFIEALSSGNVTAIATLTWHGDGLTCTEDDERALAKRRSQYAQQVGGAMISQPVAAVTIATRTGVEHLAVGERYEGCIVQKPLTIEKWMIPPSGRALRTFVVLQPEGGEWRVVRLEP